jgi:hypothetical protein
MGRQRGDHEGLRRLEGAAWQRLCTHGSLAQQALGAWPSRADISQACAGLRGTTWWSGDHAGQCRPEGHGPVEIVNVCGSLVCQALGVWLGGDHVGLKGGNLGERGPGGAEEQAQG